MRTTLDIDDVVLRRTKQLAASQGRTLTSVIEEALRTMLTTADTTPTAVDVSLPTFGGDGVRVGIDLARWDTVRDAVHDEADATLRSDLSDAPA
jgi:hypothetical protein